MEYINSILLGLVQGITEFLPVSSSGHLMLLEELGVGEASLLFNLMLHLATLLAVCIIYRKKIIALLKQPLSKETLYLVIATVPTAIIAFFVRLLIEPIGIKLLPFGFMVTTVLLVLGSLKWNKKKEMNTSSAIIVGITQGIAAIGGISRSGSTVSVQLMLGIDREKAGDFSFLLSIPIILGSAIVEVFGFSGFGKINIVAALLGMAAAFFSGLLSIKVFLKILKRGKLLPLAVYTFILCILSFIIIYA